VSWTSSARAIAIVHAIGPFKVHRSVLSKLALAIPCRRLSRRILTNRWRTRQGR